jgi:hypothetical protein
MNEAGFKSAPTAGLRRRGKRRGPFAAQVGSEGQRMVDPVSWCSRDATYQYSLPYVITYLL